jgi:hypothetical protein
LGLNVKVRDKGFNKLLRDLKKANGLTLTVGVQGPKGARLHPRTGMPMWLIARWNEFGNKDRGGTTPQRSFLRSTMFQQRAKFRRSLAIQLGKAIRGQKTYVEALSGTGRLMVKETEKKIHNSRAWAKPNRPSTKAKKGHGWPLHHDMILKDSVTYLVRDRGRFAASGGSR